VRGRVDVPGMRHETGYLAAPMTCRHALSRPEHPDDCACRRSRGLRSASRTATSSSRHRGRQVCLRARNARPAGGHGWPRKRLVGLPRCGDRIGSGGVGGWWGGDHFVFDGRVAAEGGLLAASVVGAFDPGDDRDAELVAGVPTASVHHVALRERE
jgi:hypothetical protein